MAVQKLLEEYLLQDSKWKVLFLCKEIGNPWEPGWGFGESAIAVPCSFRFVYLQILI